MRGVATRAASRAGDGERGATRRGAPEVGPEEGHERRTVSAGRRPRRCHREAVHQLETGVDEGLAWWPGERPRRPWRDGPRSPRPRRAAGSWARAARAGSSSRPADRVGVRRPGPAGASASSTSPTSRRARLRQRPCARPRSGARPARPGRHRGIGHCEAPGEVTAQGGHGDPWRRDDDGRRLVERGEVGRARRGRWRRGDSGSRARASDAP